MLKAIHYDDFLIYTINKKEKESIYEVDIDYDEDLFLALRYPDLDDVAFIRKEYSNVSWVFFDRLEPQLRIEYGVEDDSLHIFYNSFNFKTKYTIVNIIKSQLEHDCAVCLSIFDNNVDDIVDDVLYDDTDTINDLWLHDLEELSNKYFVNSRHVSLQWNDKEDDGEFDTLIIIFDTETDKIEGNASESFYDQVDIY